jgi:hypothetical protein
MEIISVYQRNVYIVKIKDICAYVSVCTRVHAHTPCAHTSMRVLFNILFNNHWVSPKCYYNGSKLIGVFF